jgi:hypothetical protein
MKMPSPTSCLRTRRDVLVRLSLALLLALVPLLALAHGPVGQSGDDPAGAMQMPCHGATADAGVDPDLAPACPHCNDVMISGHCDCCDQAAPAGIPALLVSAHFGFNGPDRYPPARLDPAAPDPLDTPYRPPTRIG